MVPMAQMSPSPKIGLFGAVAAIRTDHPCVLAKRLLAWLLALFRLPLSQADTRASAVFVDELDAGSFINLPKTNRSTAKSALRCKLVATALGERAPIMTKFEDLPANTRALILAKLASELHGQELPSIYHLAKQRRTDLMGVWRGICRKANQPICTIPIASMYPPQ